jgi:hypothetical protein
VDGSSGVAWLLGWCGVTAWALGCKLGRGCGGVGWLRSGEGVKLEGYGAGRTIHHPQRAALPGDVHALEVPAAWLCSWVLGGRCAGAVLQQLAQHGMGGRWRR